MDHTGGVRGLLAEGAILVVGQGAGAHFRRVLDAPATRNPDLRPRDFRGTPILEVPESHVMSDARGRQVIVYRIDNPHSKSYLIGYVPDAKLGYVTDLWSPGRDPLPAKITPPLASVVTGVKKHGIEPARFAGGHGSSADYMPLQKLAGESLVLRRGAARRFFEPHPPAAPLRADRVLGAPPPRRSGSRARAGNAS